MSRCDAGVSQKTVSAGLGLEGTMTHQRVSAGQHNLRPDKGSTSGTFRRVIKGDGELFTREGAIAKLSGVSKGRFGKTDCGCITWKEVIAWLCTVTQIAFTHDRLP
ncbi:hypothetical protein E2C01_097777 [Portunus trituberculatus]|uniref:Uncharacterized protein n=1 Tax=Portunus trituberculatus TaxID=210409 RepID=A0A5B7K599_PORTR|nr:hypothetical protein [Portunus trituberculatus]